MSTLFLTPFLLLLFGSMPFLLMVGKREPRSPAERKSARIGGVLLGLAFVYFTIGCLFADHYSARPEITGVLDGLRQHHSSRSSGSNFSIVVPDGSTVDLSAAYTGDKLKDDDVVRVRYFDFDKSLVSLTILRGPNSGWTLTEPESGWLSYLGIPLALLGFYLAYSCGKEPVLDEETPSLPTGSILNRKGKLVRSLRPRRAQTGST